MIGGKDEPVSRKAFKRAINDVDIRLLRIFLTVVDCGGFSAAEIPLGISRSAVSKHIADLEMRLGLKLCNRGRGGFALTDSGKEVYEAAEQTLQSLDQFRSRINRLHTELIGSLHIAVVDSTISDPVSPLVAAMRKISIQSPAVEITLSIMSSAVMETAMLDDRIHIGILPRRSILREQITYKHLYNETSMLYCSKGHPLFSRTGIVCEDLLQQRFISPSYTENHQLNEILEAEVSPSAIARNVEGTAMLILTGQFLGFLPTHFAHQLETSGTVRAVRPDYFTVHTPMDVIYKARKDMDPILENFLQELSPHTI